MNSSPLSDSRRLWLAVARVLPPVLLVLMLGPGCPKRVTTPVASASPEEALQRAIQLRQAEQFKQAGEAFTNVIFTFPGSAQASDAQYYLAETHFAAKDYAAAQTEYEFYLKSFPNGRFQEQATFELALSHLRASPGHVRDQTAARRAREMLEDFLSAYPETKLRAEANEALAEIDARLARKELDAARLYFKAGEFKAALVYYEYVAGVYPGATLSSIDRYRLAVCYAETGRASEARPLLEEIAAGGADAGVRRLAQSRLARLPPPH
uniref:Outer membrane protein assembly factor BamD n=1 Tax=candidate division WOR-3 bacterium TaxID=2052148 RepID=A0A7C4GG07_UNCW3